MDNKFFTKEGWLTRYAMACGYMHTMPNSAVTLYLENAESDLYSIKVDKSSRYASACTITYGEDFSGYSDSNGVILWYQCTGIKNARKEYRRVAGEIIPKRYESRIKRNVYA